jgi:NAD(P)-dependent dehydrogenase (short-subunit alcohol dehydrogenase family)
VTPRPVAGTAEAAEEAPVALVTGGAGGLGRAIVAALRGEGWIVVPATHSGSEWAADLGRRGAAEGLVARVLER